jgi:hypothetical protein
MTDFKLVNLEKIKYVADFSAVIEIGGKSYETTVRYINFMDGSCEYHVNGKTLPVGDDTLQAISKAIIDEHFRQITEGESDMQ